MAKYIYNILSTQSVYEMEFYTLVNLEYINGVELELFLNYLSYLPICKVVAAIGST
jgi:hypothetical protein